MILAEIQFHFHKSANAVIEVTLNSIVDFLHLQVFYDIVSRQNWEDLESHQMRLMGRSISSTLPPCMRYCSGSLKADLGQL